MKNECLDKMINDHWAYIDDLLQSHCIQTDIIELCEFHYKTAFEHGYKHGIERDCVSHE